MCREGVETFTLNFIFSLNKTCLLELSKRPLTHLKDPPQGWSLRWATEICPWMENSRYDFGRIGERLSLLHRPVLSWKVLCSWDSLNYQPSTWAWAAVTDRIKRLGAARINISEDWCLFVTFIQSAVRAKNGVSPPALRCVTISEALRTCNRCCGSSFSVFGFARDVRIWAECICDRNQSDICWCWWRIWSTLAETWPAGVSVTSLHLLSISLVIFVQVCFTSGRSCKSLDWPQIENKQVCVSQTSDCLFCLTLRRRNPGSTYGGRSD